jgi:hypothetical protein
MRWKYMAVTLNFELLAGVFEQGAPLGKAVTVVLLSRTYGHTSVSHLARSRTHRICAR